MFAKKYAAIILTVFITLSMASPMFAGENKKIDINTATEKELTQLKKIGPALAKRIVEYRVKNGLFKTTHDIVKVKGVGEKTFVLNKDAISAIQPLPKTKVKPTTKKK